MNRPRRSSHRPPLHATLPATGYLTLEQAAELLGLSVHTLEKWRRHGYEGVGPRYRLHGRHVRYDPRDLLAWSESKAVSLMEKLKPGTHGNISASKQANGRWRARVRYCNLLGEESSTSATGPTKQAAKDNCEDNCEDKVDELLNKTIVSTVTTVGELCWNWYDQIEAESTAFWSRPDAAERRGETPPRPQSLVHSKRAVNYVCAEHGGIGNLRLEEVTTLTLEQWLDGHKRISRSRAAEIRIALRSAFRSAVRLGILLTDPMAGVSPVRRHDPRPVALEADELQTIRKVLRDEPTLKITRTTATNFDTLLVLLLGAALRVGEAVALRWSDLMLDAPIRQPCRAPARPGQ